ncbi:ferrochelatase [Pullulanibacillus pueri]|uniref:Coproporphyrin III ferrochelatase n=1 Tax=Pullulanibacillus pueri TaxID=1437324 RepID=A0A8J3ENB1_9BACL|nr:ferrochelatase [Pullulanibacillus pueri]MBM7683442.1 ferrochelatase [Pullulanibacillus pueri]GGH87417.1 ferrochelatase [Pullulanibacillus pueri]
MARKKMGLLVMAYGTPYKPEDIEAYYTDIRHGRRPSDEQLEDLKSRYEAIGGVSPLARITNEQKDALEAKLNETQDEIEFKAYLGLKHIHPFIEDGVEAMHNDGIKEAVAIVLAPHYSTFSVKSYTERAQKKAEELGGLTIIPIESWYKEPGFINMWANKIKATFAQIPEAEHEKTVVVISAHSLPEKILKNGDPYPDQLHETAELVAEAAGIKHYALGWQSEGNTPDPWLGPDVQDLTRDLFQHDGFTSFIYCPVGFVAEHLEVLYDNDYECRVVCEELGAHYHRPPMPNAEPAFIELLTTVVLQAVKEKATVR